jgi:MtN3 and saliva related transmembrane protein
MAFLFSQFRKEDLSTIEIVGIAAGVCTSISVLPQLVKIIKRKNAEDISLFYLGILLVGLALWVWYGLLREDTPIIITNTFSLIMNLTIIILGIKFKNHHHRGDNK